MSYKQYKGLNLPAIDVEILAFWEREDIFRRSMSERNADNSFVFYEGPPSANGKPGIHHVMARTVKDLFCRYHTMKGKRVERKGGWDTHGLPIEISVEKALGITKDDIGTKISIDDYNKKCRETVMQFKDIWDEVTVKMGYWVDLENPYITFENDYIESVWTVISKLYDKDLLYKGYTVQPYSPAAGTGLSTHELNLPGSYKDIKDLSITAQFKVIRDSTSEVLYQGHDLDVYFLAWTTTPWTLPSNCAVAVGKKIGYVTVQTFNTYTKAPIVVVLAKDLMSKYFNPKAVDLLLEDYDPAGKLIPYKIISSFNGSDLVGIHYEQLMPYVQPEEGDAFRVIPGDFVSTEDGTGIVHTASLFGADDFKVAREHNVPSIMVRRGKDLVPIVDFQGRFVEEVGEFGGANVREEYYSEEERNAPGFESTDVRIAVLLKKDNKAFKVEKYQHNYPHCWRTDKPILYYPLDSWFIRASSMRDKMAQLNKTIKWKPAHTGEKRFQGWLENLQDWNLSRSRYWGIPIPIWRTENAHEEICIASIEQLSQEIAKANKALGLTQETPKDLHRPYIDDVILVSDTGQAMRRELDLIDVWFDSGSMPYAQWHYPFENEGKFENNFPADFISEGVDQTRGWFYSLHAIAIMTQDSIAFKNVLSTGLVLDKNGLKMSKSKGNAVDPFTTLDKYGADATRWYLMTNSNPWDNLKFDENGIDEVRRKLFGTLYNTYSFFALYANIDSFKYAEKEIDFQARPEIDQWILSLLNTLIKEVDADYADYEPTKAGRRIQAFIEDNLSNWYVRLNRRRFWKGDYTEDKISAYQTLYTCLLNISKLMAPISPFFSEWLYRNLNETSALESTASVHLSLLPTAREDQIDKDLEQRMEYAQRISSLVHSLRRKEQHRVRQPLQKIMIPALDQSFQDQVTAIQDLILHEVNVKHIEFISDNSGVIKKRVKPNFKTLGKRLGKNMKAAAQLIAGWTQEDIIKLENDNLQVLMIDDQPVELSLDDVEISSEDIPGWLVANDRDITVALDVTITEDLKDEGIARELVNRIQNRRKDLGFEVLDRISVEIEDHKMLYGAMEKYADYIKNEVLADTLTFSTVTKGQKIAFIDEVELFLHIEAV